MILNQFCFELQMLFKLNYKIETKRFFFFVMQIFVQKKNVIYVCIAIASKFLLSMSMSIHINIPHCLSYKNDIKFSCKPDLYFILKSKMQIRLTNVEIC